MTTISQLKHVIDYESILNEFKKYQEKDNKKKREKAYRMDLAKRWVAMGMDPSQVQAILGVTLSNVMNIYKAFPKKVFKEDLEEIYKKSLDEVKNIYKATIDHVVRNTHIKFSDEDFNNNKLLNLNGLKKIVKLYDYYKENNMTLNLNLMQDFMSQNAILATDTIFSKIDEIIKNNSSNTVKSKLRDDKELQESIQMIQLLSEYKNKNENFAAKALVSKGIQKKHGKSITYNSFLTANDLKPTPYVTKKKKLDDDDEDLKKDINKPSL
jgi:hypothetical protein